MFAADEAMATRLAIGDTGARQERASSHADEDDCQQEREHRAKLAEQDRQVAKPQDLHAHGGRSTRGQRQAGQPSRCRVLARFRSHAAEPHPALDDVSFVAAPRLRGSARLQPDRLADPWPALLLLPDLRREVTREPKRADASPKIQDHRDHLRAA